MNLIAGQSTVADAATAYGVSVHKVLATLHDCLTDVYTPATADDDGGDGGVISAHGNQLATVTGHAGEWQGEGSRLVLASDSIHVLRRYLGKG